MPQESALVVDLDPGDDASRPPSPSPSSSQQQLSPEALRELVLACGREAAEDGHQQASTSTRNRLRGQLGFCFYPMPWAAAVEAVADGGVAEMGKMGRTPEGVARYWAWRDEVCDKEYATTADYVRIEIMGCEEAEAAGGERGVFLLFSGFRVFFIVFGFSGFFLLLLLALLLRLLFAASASAAARGRSR